MLCVVPVIESRTNMTRDKTAIDTIKEKRVEKRIDTGVQLITKENMNDPDNKDLLTPDLDKWLK